MIMCSGRRLCSVADPPEEDGCDVVPIGLRARGDKIAAGVCQAEVLTRPEISPYGPAGLHVERDVSQPNLLSPVSGIGCRPCGRGLTANQPAVGGQPGA